MFERDRWQEILQALKENKLRTFLTAFGIFWGMFMLMVMMGAGTGLQNGVFRQMGEFATNSCFVWTQTTTMPYKGFKKGRNYNFELKDMDLLKNKVPEIAVLSPRYHRGTTSVSRNKKTEGFNVIGDFPDYFKVDPLTMKEGRFLNSIDIEDQRKIVVIGEHVKEVLFDEGEDPIGQYLKINGVYFQVVGLYSSKHNGGWGRYQNAAIVMPLTTMQKSYNLGNIVGYFAITAKPGVSCKNIEEKTISVLKAAHYINPDDLMAVGHENEEEEFKQFAGLFSGIRLLIWIVGLGTLFAGVVGVSNIMLVVVRERTQEFGIQRAIGATPWNIISQLLLEAVFLTTLAGYIGLFIGIGLVQLCNTILSTVNIESFYNPQINLHVATSALIILVFSGMLAGIIPARKAVAMKPIDAIRSEYK
jgi:putative ABC transport system permease protein